jgi:hypothetical protein
LPVKVHAISAYNTLTITGQPDVVEKEGEVVRNRPMRAARQSKKMLVGELQHWAVFDEQ